MARNATPLLVCPLGAAAEGRLNVAAGNDMGGGGRRQGEESCVVRLGAIWHGATMSSIELLSFRRGSGEHSPPSVTRIAELQPQNIHMTSVD